MAKRIMEVVAYANQVQLSCIRPEDIKHCPNKPGYIPNLYGPSYGHMQASATGSTNCALPDKID